MIVVTILLIQLLFFYHVTRLLMITTLIIVNDEIKLPHQEITEDLIEIITVYSSKIHGTRSYKTRQIEEKKEEIS